MAVEAFDYHVQERPAINAAFMRNHRGEVCIAFSDPVYARADAILLDPQKGEVFVVVHENSFFITQLSEAMIGAFQNNKEALLTAIRPDGSLLELTAPVQIESAK